MASVSDHDISAGRAKHLGELAKVFKHRHATWRDFGQFLKLLFQDPSGRGPMGAGTASSLPVMQCKRHAPGTAWQAAMAAALVSPPAGVFLNHERFSRPCRSLGTYDEKKTSGLVVHDLCAKARSFLIEIGKGDVLDPTGRDFDYDPNLPANRASYSDDVYRSSQHRIGRDPEDEFPSSEGEDAPIPTAAPTAGAMEGVETGGADEYDEDGFFEDEDVWDLLEMAETELPLGDDDLPGEPAEPSSEEPARISSSVAASDIPTSDDSVGQGRAQRVSTKMRAAVLGYLHGFADHPGQLRTEFRRLREDEDLWVLHLCGCGLCFKAPGGGNVVGCVERSHLKLGSRAENDLHRNFHTCIRAGGPALYLAYLVPVHQTPGGDGIL